MIGTVGLNDLRIDCIIGVYPHEHAATQPLIVDVEVEYDFEPAMRSDGINRALDYDELARQLTRVAVEGRFKLLETFVEEAAKHCLQQFSAINVIRLTANKPNAVDNATAAFAKIERSRA